jgi:hypothetical protein
MDARTQEQAFPSHLPEAALAVLFSKKNIDRALDRAKSFVLKTQPKVPKPVKRPAEPAPVPPPEPSKASTRFQASVTSRLLNWDLPSRVDYVKEHEEDLHALFCRVKELGGYCRVLGLGLWRELEEELGENARQVYEDYLSCTDLSLHSGNKPNPAYWPPQRLSRLHSIPSLCAPETRKELKRLLPLPCFVLRAQAPKDLKIWAAHCLRFTSVLNTTQSLADALVLDNGQYMGLPMLCQNTGHEQLVVRLDVTERASGADQPQYYLILNPGDILFTQGFRSLSVASEVTAEGRVALAHGLIEYLPTLAAILEHTRLGCGLLKESICGKVYDMLQKDTPLLSLRSHYYLSQKLLEEIEDWDGSQVESSLLAACSDCQTPIFSLGRKCTCGLVLCRRCKLKANQHNCQWHWVQTGPSDPSKVRTNLLAKQQFYLAAIPVSTTLPAAQSNGHSS